MNTIVEGQHPYTEGIVSSIFTTRKIAIGAWTVVLLGWALIRQDVRSALWDAIRAATRWKILALLVIVVVYVWGVVKILYTIELWNWDLLKDTIVWLLFAGVALAFSGVQLDMASGIWRRVLGDQLKAVILVEYVVNTYTFALWIELVLVPALVILGMLDAMARTDIKYAPVAKVTRTMQVIFGIAVIGFAINQAVASRDSFSAIDAAREIALIPVLSVSLLPVVYVFFLNLCLRATVPQA